MYPMHEKLKGISDQSQAIHDFLEWLNLEYGVWLAHTPTVTDWKFCFAPGCQEGQIRRLNQNSNKLQWFDCGECEGSGQVEVEVERDLPFHMNQQKLLAEFFDIDLNVLEDEKRAMLEEQRKLNERIASRDEKTEV